MPLSPLTLTGLLLLVAIAFAVTYKKWLPAILDQILVRKVLRKYTAEEIRAEVRSGHYADLLNVERHARSGEWNLFINHSNSANRSLNLPDVIWFVFDNTAFLARLHQEWQGPRYEEPVPAVEAEWKRWQTVTRIMRRVLNTIQYQRTMEAMDAKS